MNLNDEKRGVEESYTSAMATSNMRVEAEVRGDADVIIAAGMNKSRLGGALLRLRTEFDRAERPRAPTVEQIQALANTMLIEVTCRDKKGHPAKKLVPDVRAASKEAWRWYGQELHAFMGKLKSMSSVAAEISRIAKDEGADATTTIAPQIIAWWLVQNCHVCTGREEQAVEGTGRLSGRACGKCHGSGKSLVPHGATGRRLANVMDECVQAARSSISLRLHALR